jgi:hypothetical protein
MTRLQEVCPMKYFINVLLISQSQISQESGERRRWRPHRPVCRLGKARRPGAALDQRPNACQQRDHTSKLGILPRMDANWTRAWKRWWNCVKKHYHWKCVLGCSYLRSELVSLGCIPRDPSKMEKIPSRDQGGEILTAYILSFGLVSTEKAEGDCCRSVKLIRFRWYVRVAP